MNGISLCMHRVIRFIRTCGRMSTGKVVEALKSPFRGRHGQLHSFRRIVKELMIGAMTENKKKMLLIAKDMLD